ncbi:hypothetical protein Leryth_025627, partial [Lithospermum erythrorhizon]
AKDILFSIPNHNRYFIINFVCWKRIIDPKRASMNTKTFEMLLYGGDWVKEMYGLKKGRGQNILSSQLSKNPLSCSCCLFLNASSSLPIACCLITCS